MPQRYSLPFIQLTPPCPGLRALVLWAGFLGHKDRKLRRLNGVPL